MSHADVVIVGSLNADLVVTVPRLPAAGETVTGGRFARHGGGKGANQAVAAARAGARVAMVGAVGADPFGDEALAELTAEGIDVSAVARLDDAPTGVAAIVVDEAGENQIAVASGANAALTGEAVTVALERLLSGTSAVEAGHASPVAPSPLGWSPTTTAGPNESSGRAPQDESSGPATGGGAAAGDESSARATQDEPSGPATGRDAAAPLGVVLLGHEVPDEAVVAGAQAARAAGWLVVLNPAPARPLPDEVVAAAPILTPNADEARRLAGEDDVEAAARALAARTGAPVLVTLGADGALLVDGAPERLPALEVEVVDTTGAGDAVNGALAAELAAGRPLRDAARFALAAAALSTCTAGARAGMPRRDEVLAAL